MKLDPETDIFTEISLKSPRSRIWECLTVPAHISKVIVPDPNSVMECHVDLRPGGYFQTTFLHDGQEMSDSGVFLEIVNGRKLVFTDGYLEDWKPVAEPFMTGIMLLEDSADGGTLLKSIARHRTIEQRKSHESMGFVQGCEDLAARMDNYVLGT